MSTATLFSKIDLLPEHLKQQVLDYVEFLLSREHKPSIKNKQNTVKPETSKSRFAGRISAVTARQLQEQAKNMRDEWQ
jgi:Protein of unknown function (DUF2281)